MLSKSKNKIFQPSHLCCLKFLKLSTSGNLGIEKGSNTGSRKYLAFNYFLCFHINTLHDNDKKTPHKRDWVLLVNWNNVDKSVIVLKVVKSSNFLLANDRLRKYFG